jgi:hypothetical protein
LERKKKGKLSKDFGLGYRSEPSHDYAGSSLFKEKSTEIEGKRFPIKR